MPPGLSFLETDMNVQLTLLASLVLAVGCGSKETEETGDTPPNDNGVAQSDYIYVDQEATGDLTCFEAGSDVWLSQDVDTSLIATYPSTGVVSDFQEDDPVEDATFTLWRGDDARQTPDATAVSDEDGVVEADLTSCQPMTYKTATDPKLAETKDTYEAHTVVGVPSDGTISTEYTSVSDATYKLIPSLLGVTPDPDKGIIAGTAFDCNEDKIEGAQIVVRDDEGNIPESLIVRYFVDEWPNRYQEWTSADGLWVALQIPEGHYFVEMWGLVDGTLTVLGKTELSIFTDSINISNIYSGIDSGVKYPDSCLVGGNTGGEDTGSDDGGTDTGADPKSD